MGPRYLSRALGLLLVALAGLANGQAAVSTGVAQGLHRGAVRGERTAAFLDAFQAAASDDRARALQVLESERSPGAPAGARPSLPTLALALRALAGEEQVADDPLFALADSVDLQVRPGAFESMPRAQGPRSGGELGEPLTVRVYRLWNLAPAPDVELSLRWIAPDGERIHARREPFGGRAFLGRGFDMYVRAPLAEPGVWHLQPVVSFEGREVAGHPVPVWCVEALSDRASATYPADAAGLTSSALLDALLKRGLRPPEIAGPEPLLRALESPDAWSVIRRPRSKGAEPRPWLAGGFPADRNGAVVFLWSGAEGEELPLMGGLGASWQSLAERRGLGLFSLAVDAADSSAFREGLEEVARRTGRSPILVARGRAVTSLALLLLAGRDSEPLFRALVVETAPSLVPKALPPVPVLRGGANAGLTDELSLPGRVEAFLDELP